MPESRLVNLTCLSAMTYRRLCALLLIPRAGPAESRYVRRHLLHSVPSLFCLPLVLPRGFLLGYVTRASSHMTLLADTTLRRDSLDTSIIGPVTVMDSFVQQFGTFSAAVHGILVSSILLSAAFSSSFAGRPAAGCVIEGIGYGLYFGTQTVYICEIAPARVRGPLASGPRLMMTLALVVGYFVSFASVNLHGSLFWRLPFAITAVTGAGYVLVNLFLPPESPRWLLIHSRKAEADRVWDQLSVKREDHEAEVAELDSQISGILNEDAIREAETPARVLRDSEKKHATFRDL